MAIKVSMHNWMRPEPIETHDQAARAQRLRRDRDLGRAGALRPRRGQRLLDQNGLECWGAVTLMIGGRDLVHEDHYVRWRASQYVKDCLTFVAELGGKILTSSRRRSARSSPMASPEEEWELGRRGPEGVPGARRDGGRPDRRSSRSTASRRTSSTAATRRWRWPRRSAATAASASTSST